MNNIGDSGAGMIGESLKTNTTLTTLNLSCDENWMKWNEYNKQIYIQIMKWYDIWHEQSTILENQEQEW